MHDRIAAIIPALNEEDTIAQAVRGLLDSSEQENQISKIIVVDNGSSDATAKKAEEAGAFVVREEEVGYGAACLRGIEEAGDYDILLFMDADGSDLPEEYPQIIRPIIENDIDLVIGSRAIKSSNSGSLTFHQRFGNFLISFLLSLKYNQKVSDLGPFRAIKRESLEELKICDRNYGWTVEMQIKAFRQGLKVKEVPVSYRPRLAGKSKISGTIKGSFLAGKVILTYVAKDYLGIK